LAGTGAVWIFEGVIPNPAQFSQVRDLTWGIPERATGLKRDPSLRLKNGSGQDDAGLEVKPHRYRLAKWFWQFTEHSVLNIRCLRG